MSKTNVKKIVKKYADKLKAEKFPFSAVYVFGSQLTGKAREWSDIDVAVVTDAIKRNWDKNTLKLWKFREGIDDRIEPLSFTVKDFEDESNPIVYEIKKTGIKVV